MTTWNRLLLVLSWLRSGCSLFALAHQWKTSPTFCFREIRHVVPILNEKIKVIRMFDEKFLSLFPLRMGNIDLHGALDCTCHRRDRVHPGQANITEVTNTTISSRRKLQYPLLASTLTLR